MIFFLKNFFKSVLNSKEAEPKLKPEPQFVIYSPAPEGYLISAPQLSAPAQQHCLPEMRRSQLIKILSR
jgi:hypothetical protein